MGKTKTQRATRLTIITLRHLTRALIRCESWLGLLMWGSLLVLGAYGLDSFMRFSLLVLGAYGLWFFFKAERFQPLRARGYEFVQKRLFTQKILIYTRPIAAPFTSSEVAQKTRDFLGLHVPWAVFGTLLAVIVTSVVVGVLKIFFGVPRPCFGLPYCPTTYSFPSGHSAVAFAAATVLSLHYRNDRLAFSLSILASLVALSRLMLNVHRMEDLVFGAIIGIVIGIIVHRGIIQRHYSQS